MVDADTARVSNAMGVLLGVTAPIAAATLIIGAMIVLSPRPAAALPQYAAATGFPCKQCHVNPAGGGPRNDYGKAFAANGHKVPK